MKPRASHLALLLLGAYLVLFLGVRLSSLERDGTVLYRADLFWFLVQPEWFVPNWFGGSLLVALLQRALILSVAAALGLAATATGWLLLHASAIDKELDRLETFVFATAVGLSLWSSYVLVIGLLGGLDERGLLLLPCLAILWLAARRWRGRERPTAAEMPRPVTGSRWNGWACCALLFAGLIVLGSMLPPSDFDVREYHLQAPKEFYQQGRIDFLPHNVYANMPLGAEMWPLAAMLLTGDWWWGALVGKTLIGSMSLLAALGLVAAGRRFFSPEAGIRAALVYLATPWIILVSIHGLIDGVVACYSLLAVYAMLLARRAGTDRFRLLLLAGYLAGAAAGCKYPAVLFVVLPLTCWAGLDVVRKPRSWRPVGILLLTALAGGGLWYAKNAALAGNPTYPLLYSVFGGRTRTPEKDHQWTEAHRPKDFSPQALGSDLARIGLRSEWLSGLLMPLAAIGWLVSLRRRADKRSSRSSESESPTRRTAWLLAGWCLYVITAWWLCTHRIDRFWIVVLPLLALLAAEGWLAWSDRTWRIGIGVLQGVALAWSWLAVVTGALGSNRYFATLDELRVDPQRVSAWHRYFNEHVKQGKLLLIGDAQPFDLEMPVLYNTCFDDCLWEKLAYRESPGALHERLREEGITHLFVDWDEIARYRSPGNYGFSSFVGPGLFQSLVKERVLEPLPVIEGSGGRGYKVR